MPLSSDEAQEFMNKILKFPNWKTLMEEDKLKFLRNLMAYYAHNLYFHNITMSSTPPEHRRAPTEEDIKTAGFKESGGACVMQNAFITILLKTLGFNSYIVSGFVHGPGNTPDNHVICAVELDTGEKFIIDVGVGLPFHEPIPMSSLPYTTTSAGVRYRYKESEPGSGVFQRVQLDGALFGGDFADKSFEYVRYEFTMTPRTIEFFQKPLTPIFTDTSHSIFLQHPFLFRYFEEDESGKLLEEPNVFGDRKWILIRGVSVIIASDNNRNVTHYSNYDEVKEVIFRYFPKLRKSDVEKSVEYFNETVKEFGYYKATPKTE